MAVFFAGYFVIFAMILRDFKIVARTPGSEEF